MLVHPPVLDSGSRRTNVCSGHRFRSHPSSGEGRGGVGGQQGTLLPSQLGRGCWCHCLDVPGCSSDLTHEGSQWTRGGWYRTGCKGRPAQGPPSCRLGGLPGPVLPPTPVGSGRQWGLRQDSPRPTTMQAGTWVLKLRPGTGQPMSPLGCFSPQHACG